MIEIKQSSAAIDLVFYLVDSTDHVTPKTGVTATVTLSKNGAAFAAPSGAVTEISGGFYKVAANATDSNTLGMLALKATGTGADPAALPFAVVANIQSDTHGLIGATGSGLTSLAPAATALSTATWTGTIAGRIDATISSRSSHAAADVWTVGTRSLTTFGTLVADIWASATRTLSAFAFTPTPSNAADTTAIKAKTDNLPAAPAATGDIPSAAAITTAVWAAGTRSLTTFGTLVADIWASATRTLSAFAFTPTPANAADTTAIKAKTDNLPADPADQSLLTASINSAISAVDSQGDAIMDRLGAPVGATISADIAAIEGGEGGGGATASEIADAVCDELLAAHVIAGSVGAALAAASASGDPWATVIPAGYADGTAGAAIGRLNNTPPESPVIVIPDPAADASLCTVFVYSEDLTNNATPGLKIIFELVAAAAKSERLLSLKKVVMETDAEGFGQITLQRNDLITPAGTSYRVTCKPLGLDGVEITLADSTFNLGELVS